MIRPNGLVDRLWLGLRHEVEFEGYGRGWLGAQQDRRQKRRRQPDPLRGRMVDLTA